MAHRELAPFGALLLEYCAAARLTQEELAARVRLSPETIAMLERGKPPTSRRVTVELLTNALGPDAPARAQLVAAMRNGRGHRSDERGGGSPLGRSA